MFLCRDRSSQSDGFPVNVNNVVTDGWMVAHTNYHSTLLGVLTFC